MTRLHPLTVVLRGGGRGLALGSFGLFLRSGPPDPALFVDPGPAAALLRLLPVIGVAAGVGYEVARYRRFEYALTDDTLDIRSGVFARREREIPLRRIQNVDVTRGLAARAFGLATVAIETAGGGDTEATLRYVGRNTASDLQREIRDRTRCPNGTAAATDDASDRRRAAADTTAGADGREPAGSDAEPLFELGNRSLLLASLVSFDPRLLPVLLFLLPAGGAVGSAADAAGASSLALVGVGIVGAAVLGVGVWLASAVRTFAAFYGFRLIRTDDALRYERGLFSRYDGTIPTRKVQTLAVEESAPTRWLGYAALSVETAGYGPGDAPSGGSEAAVPIAPRDRVHELAAAIEPVALGDVALDRPPERARRRETGRFVLVGVVVTALALGVDTLVRPVPWYAGAALVLVAPALARLRHRHRGRALADGHVLTRNGVWRRTTRIVPYDRVQTVIERRTVFQRRWRLASVVVDTAGQAGRFGADAVAVDVDTTEARAFAGTVHERFRTAVGRGSTDEGTS